MAVNLHELQLRSVTARVAVCRLTLGRLAAAFIARSAHEALGFVRVGDYSRERLGISSGELYDLARVTQALDRLPILAAAYETGQLGWTKARCIVAAARVGNQREWLALAHAHTAAQLRTLAMTAARSATSASTEDVARSAAVETPCDPAAAPHPALTVDPAAALDDEDQIDGEPALAFRMHCPRYVLPLWNRAIELARRVAGTQMPVWQAAEAIAAEGLSSVGWLSRNALDRAQRVTARRLADEVDCTLTTAAVAEPGFEMLPPSFGASLAPISAEVLRRAAAAAADTEHPSAGAAPDGAARSPREWQIGEHAFGSAVLASQVSPDTTGMPDVTNAPAGSAAVGGIEIRFFGPASVVELVRSAVTAYADHGEPPSRGLVRLLLHVITCWEALPKHRNPIYARDGWRCAVPACTSRCNLHDHHIDFRSRGGGNERFNRVAVCAAHHQHAIHEARVRATGRAPGGISWELGLHRDGSPLLRLRGDAYARAPRRSPSTGPIAVSLLAGTA
jgi:hypothetical protein